MGLVDMDSGHVFGMTYRNFHTLGHRGCLKNKKIGILDHRGCLKIRKKWGAPREGTIFLYNGLGVHQSEGFPRTGYFIPAHVGAGTGQVWGVLPPALFQGRKSQEISSLDGTRHGVLVWQSLCKMNPRRLKMKNRCFVIFGGPKLFVVLKSKHQEEKCF